MSFDEEEGYNGANSNNHDQNFLQPDDEKFLILNSDSDDDQLPSRIEKRQKTYNRRRKESHRTTESLKKMIPSHLHKNTEVFRDDQTTK